MLSIYFQGLWAYLKQPLFDPEQPAQFNLQSFLQRQQWKHLNNCWQRETAVDNLLFEHHPTLSLLNHIIHLERCWNFTKRRSHHTMIDKD